MKNPAKIGLILFLASVLLVTSSTYQNAKAYTPPYTTVKVGLYYGGSALPSANLQNVAGSGSGYQFGILDQNRQFMPLGASTAETKISVLRDRNMVYDSANNCYSPGSTGSVVVGCYHIQLKNAYSTYTEAVAAAAAYPNSFVKYSSGAFYVCIGSYISADAANAAIASGGIGGSTVTSGTASTVTVVVTGTSTILFEFEYGSTYWLTIMPVSQGGEKCQTWFKGYRYYGGFQYARMDGGDVTVMNIVNVEDYTKGVIPYEMSNSWPLEALKAQAICARTYIIANLNKRTSFDVCTTEEDQVYRGVGQANATTDAAVDQTAGQYITYNGALCTTFYSSSDGGATENSENVWAQAIPYLKGVVDPYEAEIVSLASGYSWTVTYTQSDITSRLRSKGYNCGNIVDMAITQYSAVGNAYKVTLTDDAGKKFTFTKGESIRSALGVNSIRFSISGGAGSDGVYVNSGTTAITDGLSSSYAVGQSGIAGLLGQNNVYAITGTGDTVAVSPDAPQNNTGGFTITGTGRGHNVGMSQWGAYSMAKFHGMTYDQILKFYFTGVTIG
ncbi:stage II sporulation protein D [Sporobacter termitidis DSM 10068]|uniref:Stage II sporulation protein D n=1 Tax=Sporobacter termitidis DSM 10068 TaxID=1123282 RepID=A0A1M5TEY6_9FIRM|nr:SpoIID/LytB domain-containing protein [Sporobacter termitidis]SHH49279.1 stage II sporulation protein D [Sporobacter termitidis DSM 10068]